MQQDQPSTRRRDAVRVLSRWTGFCLPCGAEDRPLVLVWTGPAGLRVRLLGPAHGTGRLSLTCGLCGATDTVGWGDEIEAPATLVPDAPAPAVQVLAAYAALDLDLDLHGTGAEGVQDEPARPALADVQYGTAQYAPLPHERVVDGPAQHEPVQYEAVQDEPVQYEAAQYEPVQYEPGQDEPVQHEAVQDEPSRYAPPAVAPAATALSVAPAATALSTEVADALRDLGLPVGPPVSAPVTPSPALAVPGLADLPAPRAGADLDAVSLLRGT